MICSSLYCLGLVGDPLDVLGTNDRDGLDNSVDGFDCLASFFLNWLRLHGRSWFLNRRSCCGDYVFDLRGGLLLIRFNRLLLDGWGFPVFVRLCGHIGDFGLVARDWRRGGSLFLAPSEQLFDFFVVLLAEHACSFLPLQQQVVSCRYVVEAVPFDFLLRLRCVDSVVFVEHAHNFGVNRDGFFADVDRRRVRRLVLAHGVPGVSPDVIDGESLGWVRVQDMVDQILCRLREEARHLVLGLDNFLVQLLCVLVLEGQVSAHHRVQNHA